MEELTTDIIKIKAREHTRKIMISGEKERALETETAKKKPMTGKCYRCARPGHPAFRCKSNCYCKFCKSNNHAKLDRQTEDQTQERNLMNNRIRGIHITKSIIQPRQTVTKRRKTAMSLHTK